MTKKDYELIASGFRYAQTFGGDKEYTIHALASFLAMKLAKDNPLFDKVKFFKACGLLD